MFAWLPTFLGFIFVFGLVVFVHELGHFIVARLNDVQVDAFALGMGPKLFSYKRGETEYRLCIVPLGGYVKLAGEEPWVETDNPRAFANKPVLRRIAVLMAGVVCNILLGYFIYAGLGIFTGEVVMPPRVGYVSENLPAAGKLEIGDEIVEINNRKINRFRDVHTVNAVLGEGKREFKIRRDDREMTVEIKPHFRESAGIMASPYIVGIAQFQPPAVGQLEADGELAATPVEEGDTITTVSGEKVKSWIHFQQLLRDNSDTVAVGFLRNNEQFEIYLHPPSLARARKEWHEQMGWEISGTPLVVEKIHPRGEAKRLGFQEGDTVLLAGDTPVQNYSHFQDIIRETGGLLPLTVQRNSRRRELTVQLPESGKLFSNWFTGLGVNPPVDYRYYSLVTTWRYAFRQTREVVRLLFVALWGLISGQLSPHTMAGPVGIVMVTGQIARVGLSSLLGFTAFLSINLGIINLLPIPVLDGGHILLSLPEFFTGRSLPEKAFEVANFIGITLLFSLMILVTWVDLTRFGFFQYLLELIGVG